MASLYHSRRADRHTCRAGVLRSGEEDAGTLPGDGQPEQWSTENCRKQLHLAELLEAVKRLPGR